MFEKIKTAWLSNWKTNSVAIAAGLVIGLVIGGVVFWTAGVAVATVVWEAWHVVDDDFLSDDDDDGVA